MIIWLLYGLLTLITLTGISLFLSIFNLGVPPMPSSRGMREAIVTEIERFPDQKRIVDLGSGWGGLAVGVAKQYPERAVVGMEVALVPYLFSKLWYRGKRKPENLSFERRDFRLLDPKEWTIYLAYLSPPAMEALRHRFESAPPRHAVLISALFSVRPWTPSKTIRARDLHRTNIHVYEIRGLGEF